jgi:hypothetical protein
MGALIATKLLPKGIAPCENPEQVITTVSNMMSNLILMN